MLTATVQAQVPLVKLSTDTFTNPSSQHATEVEPDTYAFGSTIVSAFQVGRIFGGGSSDIGFATSTDGGAHWTNGFLPGVTQFFMGGRFSAASDPAVAFDAAHGVWLISSLGLAGTNNVLTSRSTDGINWENPVVVDDTSGFADKNWIACDSSASSPFFGHCYVEWDDAADGGRIRMSTSTDGGLTWSSPISPPNAFGLGGQPVVQPNGRVVVPYTGNGLQAFSSNNGGASWTSPVTVSNIVEHGVAGGLRTFALASAEVDGGGTVYVVWQDCRFRSNCSSNDIVMSTSTNGTTWTPPARIPIDPTSSTVDHFIPGISADPATSGSTAQLALTYYFYPRARCTPVTCKLAVGFVSSQDGGQTWSAAIRVAGPMKTTWLPQTSSGLMVGDYISTSFVNGKAFGVFAKANRRVGQVFDSAMYTTVDGFSIPAGGPVFSSAGENPVPGVKSDRGPRKFYDLDGRFPIPPPKPN
jgi:hypothetical protein